MTAPDQPEHPPQGERGSALLIILTIIGLGAAVLLVSALNKANLQIGRDKVTAAALAQAKEALIGSAASVPFSAGACGINCPRPGELPCPDTNNDGIANAPCNGNAIGRLPWKTLGLSSELRDSAGERLWYAVSTNYKNSPRVLPLNSDTLGTISVRDQNGTLIADATSGMGMVAVVISPGAALTRQDGVIQNRNAAGTNNPINYLDIANGEDNQNFINGTNNGFIQGPIRVGGTAILNDTLITISRDDIMRVTEQRVAKEIVDALGPVAPPPNPAAFNDSTCLGFAAIPANCNSAAGNRGRIPANPATAWTGNAQFLNGIQNNNWFQQNAWREVIYYTIGALTLNNPPGAPIPVNTSLVIMTGSTLSTQNRTNNVQKGLEANYLEDENLTPLNDIYTSRPANAATPFNDKTRH